LYFFNKGFHLCKLGEVRDRKTETKGTKGVEKDSDIFAARDFFNSSFKAVEGACKNLNIIMEQRKGVCIFDWTIGEIEDVTETLDLPVGHPGKSCVAIGSGRGRRVHDVAREQEALFEDILAVTLVNTNEDLARDDNSFLHMTCPIGP
jgi:hypothetical protein